MTLGWRWAFKNNMQSIETPVYWFQNYFLVHFMYYHEWHFLSKPAVGFVADNIILPRHLDIDKLVNDYYYHQYVQPNDKLPSVKCSFLLGQTRNARAANAFSALILISCRDVKQLRLANENLRIPEDTISVPRQAWICTCSLCSSVELESLFQNGINFFLVKTRT